jgi:hypothetical protein
MKSLIVSKGQFWKQLTKISKHILDSQDYAVAFEVVEKEKEQTIKHAYLNNQQI